MDNKIPISGWSHALLSVLLFWSVSNVFLGYTIREWGVHPIVYSCIVFTAASLALLLFAGQGRLARETMRSMDTWGYGLTLMLNYIILLALFSFVTSTEATLLQSIAVPISILSGWFFIGRSVSIHQLIGGFIVLTGLLLVCYDIENSNFGYILLLIIPMGIIQTIRTYIAEFHRPYRYAAAQSMSIKDRSRVIALVMFIVSNLFFIFFFGFALLMHFAEGVYVPGMPSFYDFFNPYAVIFGMIAGYLLIAPLRYFEFSATSSIKTENYLAISAFAPMATWFWEYITQPLTDINIEALTRYDAIACFLITIGGLIIALSKMRAKQCQTTNWREYLMENAQNLYQVEESREIVLDTISHFNNQINLASKALDVPKNILEKLLDDEENILSFKSAILDKVSHNYRKNVTSCDALTGLLNRRSFSTKFATLITDINEASLIFIDLDKFKPVNDTYGHEAGDFVLQETAKRLSNVLPKNSLITRLGGDEFVAVLFQTPKEETNVYATVIQNILSHPFVFQDKMITIGGSVGTAHYPHDAQNLDALLKHADNSMYKKKNS